MDQPRLDELYEQYRATLLDDVVPFWLSHSPDHDAGGTLNCLDRDGSIYNTDKAMWIQARSVWMFSKLFNTLEPRADWLAIANRGYEFIANHGFDTDGRMFFLVARDGRPLRKSRYLFTETFGTIACAEFARASGREQAMDKAKVLYRLLVDLYRVPGRLEPKVIPETRTTMSHAVPMIMLATTQELRRFDNDPLYNEVIDEALHQILDWFVKPDEKALFEVVGRKGERLNSPQGRCVNPGHAIETSWFLMQEARDRHDDTLLRKALDILDWSLDWGWDREYGGLLSFVDVEGKPAEQLEWDMKLWWPHTEALYALLLAHNMTGNQEYVRWYDRVHEWAFAHFPDAEYGEWFGYLHRDGSVALQLKGSMWKGPFHLPRALLYGMKMLEEMGARKSSTIRKEQTT